MNCEINKTPLRRIDGKTFELPADAEGLIQLTYEDGRIVPPNLYTFMPTRLVTLSCELPIEFGCLHATWTPATWKCAKSPCGTPQLDTNTCGCKDYKDTLC